ncbi:hypothetical protein AL050_07485 [Pseudomonas syringae pv. daphniphylli]|nr:hypothetical protein AL050_07485 [Pseudomonas syringae pv. daphniphylli]
MLADRMKHSIDLLTSALPGKMIVSTPRGGFLCWVRGSRHFDSMNLAMAAADESFDFIPGPFFSPAGSFSKFMALNFSAEWTPARRQQLLHLVEMIRSA